MVSVRVLAAPGHSQEIALRVPSWADEVSCSLNSYPLVTEPYKNGYLRLRREWSAGDEIVLELPLKVRTIAPASEIDAVRGCVAYERGPLVYCVEGTELPEFANLDTISVETSDHPTEEAGLTIASDRVVALRLKGRSKASPSPSCWPYEEFREGNAGVATSTAELDRPTVRALELLATPYYAWANRGPASMRVWLPRVSSSSDPERASEKNTSGR